MSEEANDKPYNTLDEDYNPFYEPDEFSDVCLVVEGKKLHVHKAILMQNSPVFERMFMADFKEKTAREIELLGKSHDLMVKFLQQIYPVHTLGQISDDSMPALLAIANEYQAKQVFANCEVQIGEKLVPFKVNHPVYRSDQEQLKAHALYVDKLLFYLSMCEQYSMKRHRAFLIERCALEEVERLEKSKFFKSVPATAVADLLNIRGKNLEKLVKNHKSCIERLETNIKTCPDRRKHTF